MHIFKSITQCAPHAQYYPWGVQISLCQETQVLEPVTNWRFLHLKVQGCKGRASLNTAYVFKATEFKVALKTKCKNCLFNPASP